ncbi:MAG: serine/threonine protein kinase, partial [Planctomycetota bacterium]
LEAKRPVREARDEARRLREARVEALAAAHGELAQALAVDPECADAEDALCELLAERFLEAEARRDRDEMLLHRRMMEERDRTGRHRARLDAPGSLTLRAFVYDCDCLKAMVQKGWGVGMEEDCTIAWRDGRPRPDLALTGRDQPVPRVRLRPEGARFGHHAGCTRREVAGVEVWIARLVERDLRLQPVDERRLGVTPILGVEVPQGSWRCRLVPAEAGVVAPLVPVRIDRAGDWTQEVVLHAYAEIPAGFVSVPGGPYIHGGRQAGGADKETRRTAHLLVARTPVSCDEYIEFLNALASSRRLGEARRRQPREADARYFKEAGGHFTLPGRPDDIAWSGALPVPAVSWRDAVAYCAWRSTRDGRVFRLLHDDEWEKAARGVDGRSFPWGDTGETTFSNTVATRAEGARLALPGSFPADESPYGIFDLAGNIETWCWNASEEPWRSWRNCRGGSWVNLQNGGRGGARHGDVPDHTARNIGFRLCIAVDGESV